jgi:hypothetical protein
VQHLPRDFFLDSYIKDNSACTPEFELEVSNFNFFFRSVQDILIIYYELKNRVNSYCQFSPYDFDNDGVRKFESVFYSDETYGGENVFAGVFCAIVSHPADTLVSYLFRVWLL